MRLPGAWGAQDAPPPKIPGLPEGPESKLRRQKVPPPKGRGIVLILIGIALLYSLFHVFVLEKGAGRAVKDSVEERDRPAIVPAERPGAAPREEPVDVPPGLPPQLAGDLARATTSIRRADADAKPTLAKIEALVAAAPEDRRSDVRGFLADRLAEAVVRGALRREALEAALVLQPTETEALRLILTTAAAGLRDDQAAPAAITFLESYPDRGGAETLARIDELILDPGRPLTVRVLAARSRPRDGMPEALKKLADDPSAPERLRAALR